MVVIGFRAASPTGVMQERRGDPPSRTVQAPHWPSPQPYLLPTRSRSSRKTLSRLAPASTSTEYLTPLISSSVTFDMKYPRVDKDYQLWRNQSTPLPFSSYVVFLPYLLQNLGSAPSLLLTGSLDGNGGVAILAPTSRTGTGFAPVSLAKPASDAGSREQGTNTSCPGLFSRLVRVRPIRPAPILPIFMSARLGGRT